MEGRYVGYAELHCKSNFSFLTGASHAEETGIARQRAWVSRSGRNR